MAGIRIPLWVLNTIFIGIAVFVTGGSMFAVMQTSITNQQKASYQELGTIMQNDMKHSVQYLLNNLYGAAIAVVDIEQKVRKCQMTDGYSPERMIELFNFLSHDPTRQLGSLGFIMKAPNSSNGKVSWQIALGFGCPDYIYAYAEPGSYPLFLGHCAYRNVTIDWNNTAYNGTDWGLKPEESELLTSSPLQTIHLPIFALIDRLMLTIEHSITCDNLTIYGAVFAEQSLTQLDNALIEVTKDDSTIAFIYERESGYLISSSVPSLTQKIVNGSILRVKTSEASNGEITKIYDSIKMGTSETDDWWIVSTNLIEGDIDWVLVSAIPVKGYIQTLRNISGMAAGIAVAIIIVVLGLSVFITLKFVSQPLRTFTQNLKNYGPLNNNIVHIDDSHPSEGFSRIEEIAVLEEFLNVPN